MNALLATPIHRIADQDDQVDAYPVTISETWQDVRIDCSISDDQRHDMHTLLGRYGDVLTYKPGCTRY